MYLLHNIRLEEVRQSQVSKLLFFIVLFSLALASSTNISKPIKIRTKFVTILSLFSGEPHEWLLLLPILTSLDAASSNQMYVAHATLPLLRHHPSIKVNFRGDKILTHKQPWIHETPFDTRTS